MSTRSLLCVPAVLLSATLAQAEVPCMPTEAAVSEIMGPRYLEYPLFEGTLANPSQENAKQPSPSPELVAVTVFANPATGTWTMMVSPNGKVSCLIMAGTNFRPAAMSKVTGKLTRLE